MSTRTPIYFGSMLQSVFADKMNSYTLLFSEATHKFLLFCYQKPIGNHYAFILVQAARNQGRFNAEAAISRRPEYPYHRFSDVPDLGVGGYRDGVHLINKGYNHGTDYQSNEGLLRSLLDLCREAETAVNQLFSKSIQRLQLNADIWETHYLQWVRAEREATGPAGNRYPGVFEEGAAFDLLDTMLGSGQFDRYMGPLKYKYRNLTFFHCHLYLLARALEFLQPPKDEQAPAPFVPKLTVADPLEDPIASLTGRLPQDMGVQLSYDPELRRKEYAFLKSLSALESFYQLDENGVPVSYVLPPTIQEEPSFEDMYEKPAPMEEDYDPIAALEARLGL